LWGCTRAQRLSSLAIADDEKMAHCRLVFEKLDVKHERKIRKEKIKPLIKILAIVKTVTRWVS
jgi:hypothetical protein